MIKKLEDRARGLSHSGFLNSTASAKDKELEAALRATLSKEHMLREQEEAEINADAGQINAQRQEIAQDRGIIADQEKQIAALDQETKNLINTVCQRGKVHVDLPKQVFTIVKPITFKPDMKTAPPPEFDDPITAKEILGDLAL